MSNAEYAKAKESLFRSFEASLSKMGKTFGVAESDLKCDIYADLAIKYGHNSNSAVNGEDSEMDEHLDSVSEDNESVFSEVTSRKRKNSGSVCSGKRVRKNGAVVEEPAGENYFASLSDTNLTLEEVAPAKQNQNNSRPGNNQKAGEKKSKRVPPIVCMNLNVKELSEACKKLTQAPKYSVININKSKTILKPATTEDHKRLFNIMKCTKTVSYTFTPPEERHVNLLVKGVHHSYSPEEVKEALKAAVPEVIVEKVAYFETAQSRKLGYKINNFMVQVAPNCEAESLRNVQFLLNQKVTWEKLKSSGITQCKNCQNFGHVARNCTAPYRCVKCKGGHQPGECNRKKIEELGKEERANQPPPFCINCGKEGHTANYRGCEAYKRLVQVRQEKVAEAKKQKEQARASVNNYIQKGKNFSSLFSKTNKLHNTNNVNAKPQKQAQTAPNSPVNNFINSECQNLFGLNLFAVISKVKQLVPKYKSLKSNQEKQVAILNLVCELCT